MSAKNENTERCQIIEPDGSDEWEDDLYPSEIEDFRLRGYTVTIL